VFPDANVPQETNGVFESREKFQQFVLQHQRSGKWDSAIHARPESNRIPDYSGNAFPRAFPHLFPYGFSGLSEDPAVVILQKRGTNSKFMKRNRIDVLRKYLQLRQTGFHGAMVNLIIANIIFKQSIFQTAAIHANMKASNGSAMAEKFGSMNAQQLQRAIDAVRSNSGSQFSADPASQFLRSIAATCRSLPHTNEASMEARKIYFSFLMKYGLPCIFLTINPDDQRNFRIVVYGLPQEKVMAYDEIDVTNLRKEDVLAEFKVRQNARSECPGLCAEEYARITELVIKHLLNWDDEKEESAGVGLFGDLLAWCLATEEQGRKTLHGHYLLFVKNWMRMMEILQKRSLQQETRNEQKLLYDKTKQNACKFFDHVCSARLFKEFESSVGVLSSQPVFYHPNCRSQRCEGEMRFTIEPSSDQHIREMRHKEKCYEHGGSVGKCKKCNHCFTVDKIIGRALNYHLGKQNEELFLYPDSEKMLDWYVNDQQKDFNWYKQTPPEIERRYFAANALVNLHSWKHATRCFKNALQVCQKPRVIQRKFYM
jgi:hypothetical protein